MKRVLVVLLIISGCEAPVDSTFVTGTVAGVSIPGAVAVNTTDKDILGGTRRTVWFGTNLQCAELNSSALDVSFGPSARMLPDGGRTPLLVVVQNGNTWLDTGNGAQRVAGTTDRFFVESAAASGELRGRFVSSFVGLPDGGGVPDGGTFSGDFVAAPCATANPGCEAAPVGALATLALVLLARRRAATSPLSPRGGEGQGEG